ncbi:MAG: YIP1 family protein [Blastocatellia bacterium]|nr:YIP1 family protein [Blastocatellia bacterium]
MNRLAGIVVAVVGLVVAILGVMKVVPGLTQPGIFLILLGGLVIGLSFIDKPESDGTPRMSTPETLLNIFIAPADTFRNLRRHPRWLVAALIITILSAVFTNLFLYRLTPERVTNFAIDKTMEMPMMNDQARQQIEAGRQDAINQNKDPVMKVGQAASSFAWSVLKYCIYALIFLGFALAMGGKINFWQAFSVAVYAAFPVSVIHSILSSIILFLKDPADIHPILGQGNLVQDSLSFLFNPSASPAHYTFAAHIGLLSFYWVWLMATGLKNTGENVSGSTAWTTALSLFGILLFLGVVGSYLFSGFMS